MLYELPSWIIIGILLVAMLVANEAGRRFGESSSEAERVYVVLEGQITVTTENGPVLLGPLDSCLIPPGETRSVQNATNRPASMLVIVAP